MLTSQNKDFQTKTDTYHPKAVEHKHYSKRSVPTTAKHESETQDMTKLSNEIKTRRPINS
jgi:hypothetical protein